MSNEEFENYLALVSRLLRLSPGQRSQIGEELRDHLEIRTAELVESGIERVAAVKQAIEEFGDAAAFAQNFRNVSVQNRKRWMMRFATVSTAVAFLVVVLAMAMWPDGARFGTPNYSTALDETAKPAMVEQPNASSARPSSSTQANEVIRRALKQPVSLDYDQETISDVIADLESRFKLNIVLTESARDDSLDVDEPVTVNLRGISCSNALKIMLMENNATYCVQDGVLKLISLDDAETDPRWLTRRMVNVNNLLTLIRQKEKHRIGKPIAATSYSLHGGSGFVGGGSGFGGGGGGGGGGGVFCHPPVLADDKDKQAESNDTRSEIAKLTEAIVSLQRAAAEQKPVRLATAESILIDVTQSATKSEAWIDTGSGICQMKIVAGIMVLVATEEINDQVESFLIDLEYAMQADGNAISQTKPIQPQADGNSVSQAKPIQPPADENPFGNESDDESGSNPFPNVQHAESAAESAADPFK